MNTTLIITDSGSDVPQDTPGVVVVPFKITFGDETFNDGVDLTHEQFYERLIESDTLPKTSMVSPFQFCNVFEQALDVADELLVITISSKLSGTYNSAVSAAQQFSGRVYVVDSLSACIGQRILVERGRNLLDAGLSVVEVVQKLEVERGQVRVLALLDTLEYLRKGGRLNAAAAVMGEMLAIKPVIAIVDGEVVVRGKARGSKNGANLLRREIIASGGVDFSRPYLLGYSGSSDRLLCKYAADNVDLWEAETRDLPRSCVGATIGTHVGPGAIAVAYFAH